MKLSRLIYAIGIGCTLCACSSNDEPGVQEELKDYTKSNKCISVAVVTTAGDTRADYADGDASEYAISGVGLYLFNRQGECVDAEYYTTADFKTTETKEDPNVTELCTVEVELSGNRVYDRIIAVLNPNSDLMEGGKLKSKSESELREYRANYSGASGKFTMSNSVYVNDASYNGTGAPTPYFATSIGAENIYTKEKPESEMDATEKAALEETRKKAAINIYVERICSKIYVDNQPDFSTYYVSKNDDGTTTDQLKVMVNEDGKSVEKTIVVVPEFQGIGLSVTAARAFFLKNLDEDLTYKFSDNITNFQWNDYDRKRSYWETTLKDNDVAATTFNYTAWSNLNNPWEKSAAADFIAYPNPNTAAPVDYDANTNEATKTTKLLVKAQLYYKYNDADTEKHELDLVMFAGSYWMADYLLYHAAERVVKHLEHISDFLPETLTEDEVKAVTDKIAEIDVNTIKEKLSLERLTSGTVNAYLAQLNIMTNPETGTYPDLLAGLNATLKGKVSAIVNQQIQNTLDDITTRQIQYWKNGQTYFYVPIRHQGFTGLSGQGTGAPTYLNGVVRNHEYKVSISQVWGLGTPVINPNDPIDPERPDNAPKSYMTAKINVLKWRVVPNNVSMH